MNSLKDPRQNSLIDPNRNSLIDPRRNSLIDPQRNSLIDPNRNSLIDPRRNSLIDPNRNSLVDPRRNSLIDPNRNSLIDPNRNSLVDPNRNSLFDGLYIFDTANNPIGFVVRANENVLNIFELNSNRYTSFAVKSGKGYAIFDSQTATLKSYIISDSSSGFNQFDLNGRWIGHLK
jgi:hypothetical protein